MTDPDILTAVSALRQALFLPTNPSQEVQAFEAIRKSLSHVVELQGDNPIIHPTLPLEDRLIRLRSWLSENGFEGLDKFNFVAGLPEGTGVVAKVDIQPGETLCRVPANLIMTTETAREHPAFTDQLGLAGAESLILTGYPPLRAIPPLLLALFLLYESLTSPPETPSFWKPYIDTLPREFGIPLHWEDAEWVELQGTSMMMKAIADYRTYLRHYVTLYEVFSVGLPCLDGGTNSQVLIPQAQRSQYSLIPPHLFTWRLFRWAVSAVLTRQNTIPLRLEAVSKGSKGNIQSAQPELAWCLIPGFDMFNHAEGKISTYYQPDAQSNVTIAPRAVKKGDQIYLSYGNRSNFENLMVTGFTTYPETLPSDLVRLRLAFPSSPVSSDPQERLAHSRRRTLLEASGFAEGSFFVDLHRPPLSERSSKLMAFLRIFVSNKEELEKLNLSRGANGDRVRTVAQRISAVGGLGPDNERRVLEWIRGRLLLLSRGWTTTAADDSRCLEELEAVPLVERDRAWRAVRDIIFVRRTEKEVVDEIAKEVEYILSAKG
ncbi:Histone-lysine N-methyltransferase setd3 [Gonapodya sp. JEL0774]|nr:Histone-lysine N-methyltransferase setd3 [Gonapodya sp. JEL0774]